MPMSEQLPDNPPSSVSNEASQTQIVSSASKKTTLAFSGPLPHPSILAGYNNIVPGSAERIIAMAESEATHQREMERFIAEKTFEEVRVGQFFGIGIATVGLGASVLLGIMGHDALAGVIGGTTIVSLATTFVVGRFTKNRPE